MRDKDLLNFLGEVTPGLLRRARLLTPDRQLAEDLTQEALTTVVAKWRQVRRADSPEAYAQRLLVNTFLNNARKRSFTETPSLISDTEAISQAPDIALTIDLSRALASLSPTQRVVVVMRHLDGRSVPDIAQELGQSEAWVRQVTHRALVALRETPERQPATA